MNLSRGIFTLSLDTELAWGTRGNSRYRADYERTRDVVRRILALCEQYRISATWAVVGHLFLDSCRRTDGVVHPDIPRPDIGTSEDWFSCDPATDVRSAPLWYAPDLIKAIQSCAVPQDIGLHGFSHLSEEPQCTPETFEAELRAARSAAGKSGLSPTAFVFPKNRVKYVNLLAANAFRVFRGTDPVWYRCLSGPLRRIGHALDAYLALPAPTVLPQLIEGVWNVPGSQYFVHRRGWARLLPTALRVRKARIGMRRAAEKKQIFHLWTHPFNVASDPDGLLQGLEQIFQEVDRLRSRGELENMTLSNIVEQHGI